MVEHALTRGVQFQIATGAWAKAAAAAAEALALAAAQRPAGADRAAAPRSSPSSPRCAATTPPTATSAEADGHPRGAPGRDHRPHRRRPGALGARRCARAGTRGRRCTTWSRSAIPVSADGGVRPPGDRRPGRPRRPRPRLAGRAGGVRRRHRRARPRSPSVEHGRALLGDGDGRRGALPPRPATRTPAPCGCPTGPAPNWPTASTCAAPGAGSTPASTCARRWRCSRTSAPTPWAERAAPGAARLRRDRPPPRRLHRHRADRAGAPGRRPWSGRACPTGTSPRSCSSAPAPSTSTCATCSASSAWPPAPS